MLIDVRWIYVVRIHLRNGIEHKKINVCIYIVSPVFMMFSGIIPKCLKPSFEPYNAFDLL